MLFFAFLCYCTVWNINLFSPVSGCSFPSFFFSLWDIIAKYKENLICYHICVFLFRCSKWNWYIYSNFLDEYEKEWIFIATKLHCNSVATSYLRRNPQNIPFNLFFITSVQSSFSIHFQPSILGLRSKKKEIFNQNPWKTFWKSDNWFLQYMMLKAFHLTYFKLNNLSKITDDLIQRQPIYQSMKTKVIDDRTTLYLYKYFHPPPAFISKILVKNLLLIFLLFSHLIFNRELSRKKMINNFYG